MDNCLSLIEELDDFFKLRNTVRGITKEEALRDAVSLIYSHPVISKFLLGLDVQFNSEKLFVEALTHTSFVNEQSNYPFLSFERLEFFGDSLFNFLVSDFLIKNFPSLKEGPLSRFRGAVVNEGSMAELARSISLGSCLLLGKGEIKSGGYNKDAILADSLEALFGAVFLDQGFEGTKKLFYKILEVFENKNCLPYISMERLENFDPKSLLQEKTMSLYKEIPEYRSVKFDDELFQVDILIGGKEILSTKHKSKKKAEKFLAKEILKKELYLLP